MPDVRELILARLTEIAGEVPGVDFSGRNRTGITESMRPALIVLDADEAVEEEEVSGRRPSIAPTGILMTPEIYIFVGARSRDIGAELNTFRRRIIRRVLTDTALSSIIGSSGSVTYAGCGTALAIGRSMEGEMALSFAFRYFLRPTDLED